jgi:hypothetical protein
VPISRHLILGTFRYLLEVLQCPLRSQQAATVSGIIMSLSAWIATSGNLVLQFFFQAKALETASVLFQHAESHSSYSLNGKAQNIQKEKVKMENLTKRRIEARREFPASMPRCRRRSRAEKGEEASENEMGKLL